MRRRAGRTETPIYYKTVIYAKVFMHQFPSYDAPQKIGKHNKKSKLSSWSSCGL
jgi:hypothetical protein